MLNLLGGLAESIGAFVLEAILSAINAVIAAAGAVLTAIFSLLPALPDVPDNPVPEATGWINWFVNAGVVLGFAATLIAAWLVILAWRVVLKWVKAL